MFYLCAISDSVTSETSTVFIRFYAEPSALKSTFSILYTAYHDKSAAGCEADEFDCEDTKCIMADLKCNGHINCQFRWDEEDCPVSGEVKESDHITIIVVVFGLILGGMMVTFLINCLRKIARDQKVIREHIRQSRESEIEALGRRELKKSMESINRIKDHAVRAAQMNEASMYQRQDSGREVDNNFLERDMDEQQFGQSSSTSGQHQQQQEHDVDLTPRSHQVYPVGNESKMCETAVQTRESLFQNVHIIKPPSEYHAPEARLSSFGKPHPPPPLSLKPMHGSDAYRQHPHHYDTRPHADRYGSSYSQQDSERKSAPDVIIMTSVQR